MKHTCVLVSDVTEARIFSVEMGPGAGGRPELKLVERKSLVNPERMMKGDELYSANRHDASRRVSGAVYTVDDHRNGHEREVERKFAVLAAKELDQVAKAEHAERVVIAAAPRMLGHLRGAREGLLRDREVIEESLDIGKLSGPEIADRLRESL